jgi:all-trans-retinol dehydrogenase (NAD+)
VVAQILRAIEANRAQLHTPWMVHTIPLIRLLPTSWFDAVARFMGISASMDEFVGRRA